MVFYAWNDDILNVLPTETEDDFTFTINKDIKFIGESKNSSKLNIIF